MEYNKKNNQIGFILKELYQYYYDQSVDTNGYVSFERYLLYQMKLAYECGILNQSDIYDVIRNYEEMVDNPDIVLCADFVDDGKYSKLFDIVYNSDFNLYEDLLSMKLSGNTCPYGNMCFFLKGEKKPSKYRIFFEVAKSARFFYGVNALDLYLPYKDDDVVKNEQKIIESDYGMCDKIVDSQSRKSLRTVSWYLNTHKSFDDLGFIFAPFNRGENFMGIKNSLIDIYGEEEDYSSKPQEEKKSKSKRKTLIDRIIDKKISTDFIE